MFSSADTELDHWNVLTETEEVDTILEASQQQPQLVYKHSFTCGICHMAREEIEKELDAIKQKAAINFVDVKKSRAVSNAFAKRLDVRHESPQVLIIDDNEVIWHASHHAIKSDTILEALGKL